MCVSILQLVLLQSKPKSQSKSQQ